MTWMIDEIRSRGGAIPFDVFMELALYHPDHGYYSGATVRYGRSGDFLTAPTASPWYSRVVARLLTEMAAASGPLRLVDLAAGDGSFLAGVMDVLGLRRAEVLSGVVAVERSAAMRERVLDRFEPDSVECVDSLLSMDLRTGSTIVHASELYDAMPVVRVVGDVDGLQEMWVTATNDRLGWEQRPAKDEVVEYFQIHGVQVEPDQIAEANLGAVSAHRTLLEIIGEDGLALILDYGYEARRLYNSRGRALGSLATFHNHQVGRDPLVCPGEMDLTAHVNWDDLRRAADGSWLEVGLWSLAEFLVRAGIADELEERGLGMEAEIDADTFSKRQEIKRLLDPDGMGSDLKVMVQAKGKLVEASRRVLALK